MTPAAASRDLRPLRRKTIALLAASATVAAGAALLTARGPRAPGGATTTGDCARGHIAVEDGLTLAVRPQTCHLLRGAGETHVAVELEAPDRVRSARPPVAMALVIDRSGSMVGEPMRDAKAAALRALASLDAEDHFAVVTYSTGAELVTPLVRATDANKAAARAAIETIRADGGTNISAGLDEAARALDAGAEPTFDRVSRIVLISDGQANEGVYHRDGLAALAARTAEDGTSVTTIGVGLEFDERTMTEMAVAGRGNYHFVERPGDLARIFEQELGSLGDTVAVDARLEVTPAPGVEVLEAYGYRIDRVGGRVIVPIADLRAGETRKVVLRVRVVADATGARDLLAARLAWRSTVSRQARSVTARAAVTVTDDVAAVDGSRVAAAERQVQEAQLARAIDEATEAYERGDVARAEAILEERAADASAAAAAIGDAELDAKVGRVKAKVQQNFAPGADPRRGAKDNRGMSYELAR